MSSEQLASFLGQPQLSVYLKQLEKELNLTIGAGSSSLDKAASQLLNSGGKRLRPVLVFSSALIISGGELDGPAMAAARAVELVHLASLVHDDWLDRSARRRGQAAIHHQQDARIALLTGDYLLALACAQAADHSQQLAVQLSKTIAAMADGQARQFGQAYRADPSSKVYLDIIRKKTAALFETACWAGGLGAGAKPAQLKALGKYGVAFGMAFQIIDDWVDKEFPGNLRPLAAAQAKKYCALAEEALEAFIDSPVKDSLGRLPSYYLDWALPAKVL